MALVRKLEGIRRRGCLRRRWCEDVEGDLREIRMTGWRSKVLGREEWRRITEQAKGSTEIILYKYFFNL